MSGSTENEAVEQDIKPAGSPDQGMDRIRKEKRLAIYLRDGMACVYCGDGVEDGADLTLDRLKLNIRGGGDSAFNLVTACGSCSARRGALSLRAFCRAMAEHLGNEVDALSIEKEIRNTVRRKIDTKRMADLLARRGAWLKALKPK